MCRVAHFFDGNTLRQAIAKVYDALTDGGKFYLIAETPYLRNWQKFIPEYEKRKKFGSEWPGLIENVSQYTNSKRLDLLPKLVHWLDKNVLKRELEAAGFQINEVGYINRDYFPDDIRLDGRESVGIVGVKRAG